MKLRNWTPALTLTRIASWVYQMRHPGYPWLSPWVNDFLGFWLKKTDTGLEFGSGRSTAWLAQRVKSLTSVEHDTLWYQRVEKMLARCGIDNCDYILATTTFTTEEHLHQEETAYVSVADKFADNSLDFVLVDGVYRGSCAHRALAKIRPGGLLIVDDSQDYYWYPEVDNRCDPPFSPEPGSEIWREVLKELSDWRRLRESTRLKTTDVYIKLRMG